MDEGVDSRERAVAEPRWLDGHFHVFLKAWPTVANARHTPQYDAPLDDYLTLQQRFALGGGLLVQPSFFGTDNRYLLATLKAARRCMPEARFRGVASVAPDVTDAELAALDTQGIVGIRLNLVGSPPPSLSGRAWQKLFTRLRDRDWHVEIQIEGWRLPAVLSDLLEPGPRVVVDHFGRLDAADPMACPGFRRIVTDRSERLWVKISAPYRVLPGLSQEDAARRCRDIGRRYADALGPGALVWGSDWPWTQHEAGLNFQHIVDWRTSWLECFSLAGLTRLVPQLRASPRAAQDAGPR